MTTFGASFWIHCWFQALLLLRPTIPRQKCFWSFEYIPLLLFFFWQCVCCCHAVIWHLLLEKKRLQFKKGGNPRIRILGDRKGISNTHKSISGFFLVRFPHIRQLKNAFRGNDGIPNLTVTEKSMGDGLVCIFVFWKIGIPSFSVPTMHLFPIYNFFVMLRFLEFECGKRMRF